MNPEVSPWMVIANRQRSNDIKREQQQRDLKNIIRIQYQKQLDNQINLKNEVKIKQKQREKEWEKSIINSSIQSQKKIIQLERMKAQVSSIQQTKLDYENQYYKSARKQREEFLDQQNKRIQNSMHQQAEERTRLELQELDRKKKMTLESLKDSIENKQIHKKFNKYQEDKFENKKLYQNEALNQREEHYRDDYLRKLKQKAATIDYGSHQTFENNHYKTLVQKKKQQWENQQEYFKRAHQLNQYEEQVKRTRANQQRGYAQELKRQISQREDKKVQESRRELYNDQTNIARSQNFSKSLEISKKEIQGQNKKHLLEYLTQQVEERKRFQSQQPYYMRDKQIQMNIDLLQKSKGIIPGQTYELDPERKKQLETVAKSLAYSPLRAETKYLAERGRTILH